MADELIKKLEESKVVKKKFTWADFDKEKFYKETEAIRDIFIKKEKEKYGDCACGCVKEP